MTTKQIYIIVLGVIILAAMAVTTVIIIKGYTRSDGVIAIGAVALGALATLAHTDRSRQMIWPDDMRRLPSENETLEIPGPLFDQEKDDE